MSAKKPKNLSPHSVHPVTHYAVADHVAAVQVSPEAANHENRSGFHRRQLLIQNHYPRFISGYIMKTTIIDAQNHPCPKPIIMTKQAVDNAEPGTKINVLINRESAKNNTLRFLQDNNIPVTWEQNDDIFTLHITKPEQAANTEEVPENACSIGCEI
jgi:TusA-related sulfurtransferase